MENIITHKKIPQYIKQNETFLKNILKNQGDLNKIEFYF